MENLLSILDGSVKGDFGQGALVAIFAIILVFTILSIIIGITSLVNKGIKKFEKQTPKNAEVKSVAPAQKKSVNIADEDAMVAVLVASVDLREKTKKQVKVISVKEIK